MKSGSLNLLEPSGPVQTCTGIALPTLITYTKFTEHVRFYLPLRTSVTVSISTVGAFIFLTLTPNIPILFTAIPQHIIISPTHCTEYTALLKTPNSHFRWHALLCRYDPHRLNTTFICLGLHTHLKLWRSTIFSTDGVSGVKNLRKCMYSGFLCRVCGPTALSS